MRANTIILVYSFIEIQLTYMTCNTAVVRSLPANAGDVAVIPESGRSPGGRNGNPLQYRSSILQESHGEMILVGYSPKGSG